MIKYYKSKDKQGEGYILSVNRPLKTLFYGFDDSDDRLAKWSVFKVEFKNDDELKAFLDDNKKLKDAKLLVEIDKAGFDTLKINTDGYSFAVNNLEFAKSLLLDRLSLNKNLVLDYEGKTYQVSLALLSVLSTLDGGEVIAKDNTKVTLTSGKCKALAKLMAKAISDEALRYRQAKDEVLNADVDELARLSHA